MFLRLSIAGHCARAGGGGGGARPCWCELRHAGNVQLGPGQRQDQGTYVAAGIEITMFDLYLRGTEIFNVDLICEK
jgi:hypothetical protein